MADTSAIPHTIGNYILKRQIGKGSFATVWRAEHRLAKTFVAIKIVDNSSLQTEDAKTRFVREINLIKQMDHPFISKLFEVIDTPQYTYLIMEYAENGSILTYVNSHGRLPEKQARRYFSQLLSALEYLHNEKKVAHRDLKAENVLLDRNLNIRLIDFGLSNSFSEESPELSTACGSPAYASPEMVRGQPYTKMADIWSSGVLLYAMVTGQLPFDDDNMQHLLQKIAFTEPQYPSFLSPQLVDLLKKVMTKSPDQRASIAKIKTHPWFSQSEYSQFLKLQFSTDDQWLVSGVDKDIVDKIASYGVDVRQLTQNLLCGNYNEITAIYLILRRDKITDNIKDMMQSLNSPNANSNQSGLVGGSVTNSPSLSNHANHGVPQINVPIPSGQNTSQNQIPKASNPASSRQTSSRPIPVPSMTRNRQGSQHSLNIPTPSTSRISRSRKNSNEDAGHLQNSEKVPSKGAEGMRVPSRPPTPQKGMVKRGRVNSLIVK
ncbi:CAMK family protein kinase [Tritrichomonas foetus]|uniref:non-specific serine/threonine protein kinase n=1 Tax=Tritrichomonas foetus TaxID=1144522 RepID=A0A1J4KRC3_9EUKA|nr:CAMK family protein kinase [Tritrichomonas foetus]|eukprot:OHT13803.1 CAMK family protein kinase [Tritrichomonas foetus]